MITKNTLIGLCLYLITSITYIGSCFSQESRFTVSYTDAINCGPDYHLTNTIIQQTELILQYKNKKENLYDFYRVSGKNLKHEKMGSFKLNNPESTLGLTSLGSRVYSPYFATDRNQKLNCLLLQEFDLNELSFSDDPITVDCLQGDDFYHNFENSFASYATDKSRSLLLIYYKLPELKDGTKVFRFTLIDKDLNLVWRTDAQAKIDDQKVKIGNKEWGSAGGMFGGTSGNAAIVMDEKGDVYFWSVTEPQRRGDPLKTFVSRVNGDGVVHEEVTQSDCEIVMNWINPLDFRLIPSESGIFISAHLEKKGRDKDTKWANRGKLFGKWDDSGISVNTYPYSYKLLLETFTKSEREKYSKLKERGRPVGWMVFPPKTNSTSFMLKKDGGMYYVERGPNDQLIYSVSRNGELSWVTTLIADETPSVYDGGDEALLSYQRRGNMMVSSIMDDGMIEIETRKMTDSEKGDFSNDFSKAIQLAEDVFVTTDRSYENGFRSNNYSQRIGFLKILR